MVQIKSKLKVFGLHGRTHKRRIHLNLTLKSSATEGTVVILEPWGGWAIRAHFLALDKYCLHRYNHVNAVYWFGIFKSLMLCLLS